MLRFPTSTKMHIHSKVCNKIKTEINKIVQLLYNNMIINGAILTFSQCVTMSRKTIEKTFYIYFYGCYVM